MVLWTFPNDNGLLIVRQDKTKQEQEKYEEAANKVKDKARYQRIMEKIGKRNKLSPEEQQFLHDILSKQQDPQRFQAVQDKMKQKQPLTERLIKSF